MRKVNSNECPTIDEVLEDAFFADVADRVEQKNSRNGLELSEITAETEMGVDVSVKCWNNALSRQIRLRSCKSPLKK
jgi:hypothetical protein